MFNKSTLQKDLTVHKAGNYRSSKYFKLSYLLHIINWMGKTKH